MAKQHTAEEDMEYLVEATKGFEDVEDGVSKQQVLILVAIAQALFGIRDALQEKELSG